MIYLALDARYLVSCFHDWGFKSRL